MINNIQKYKCLIVLHRIRFKTGCVDARAACVGVCGCVK